MNLILYLKKWSKGLNEKMYTKPKITEMHAFFSIAQVNLAFNMQ